LIQVLSQICTWFTAWSTLFCWLSVFTALALFPMSVKAAARANGGGDRDKLLGANAS
jgi:hypothetical protein